MYDRIITTAVEQIMEKQGVNERVFLNDETVKYYTRFTTLFDKEKKILDTYYGQDVRRWRKKILDVGCGAGRITNILHQLGHEVVGIDVSAPLIAEARHLYPAIQFEVGDACQLPYGDASFDHVWFSFNGLDFIHPYARRLQALREIYRVLKPGGLFIFSSHNSLCFVTLRTSRWRDLWRNAVSGRLLKQYRTLHSEMEGTTHIFHQNPVAQVRTLQNVGFAQCDIVSSYHSTFRQIFSDSWPYYVAHKPTRA